MLPEKCASETEEEDTMTRKCAEKWDKYISVNTHWKMEWWKSRFDKLALSKFYGTSNNYLHIDEH